MALQIFHVYIQFRKFSFFLNGVKFGSLVFSASNALLSLLCVHVPMSIDTDLHPRVNANNVYTFLYDAGQLKSHLE